METRKKFRKMLSEPGVIVAPGCFDGLSAKLIKNAGFSAMYLGSFAATSTLLGQPDIGLITSTEYLSLASRITQEVDLPLIADAEDGYGDLIGIRKTVKDYERAGVAAMHIEDHVFGKHIAMDRGRVLPIEEMTAKLKQAVDARTDPDMVIIARTEAWAYKDVNIAVERGCAMAEAGADMIMLSGLSDTDCQEAARQIPVPLVMLNHHKSEKTVEEFEADNVKLLICWYEVMLAAKNAMEKFLHDFKAEGSCHSLLEGDYTDLEDLLGMEEWRGYMKKA